MFSCLCFPEVDPATAAGEEYSAPELNVLQGCRRAVEGPASRPSNRATTPGSPQAKYVLDIRFCGVVETVFFV
jgi:hypothetical protein